MSKDLHEVHALHEFLHPVEHGLIDSQFIASEQFPVVSAYVETLPNGLIGDEI